MTSNKKETIKLHVISPRDKISYSEWMLFRTNCEWRWHLEYAENKKIRDKSIALEFGTAMHSTLEDLLLRDKDKRISIDEAILKFTDKFWAAVESLHSSQFMKYGPWN